jgi:hypothetical protein
MGAKRGDLKPVDEWEENIRNNAKYYNVVGFIPGKGGRTFQSFENLLWAKAYASELVKDKTVRIRSAMIYAIGPEYDHFALVGSYDTQGNWKEVIPKRW